MKIVHLDLNDIEHLTTDTALLMGTFDGFHLGHQSLLERAKEVGKHVAVLLIFTSRIRTKEHQKSGFLTTIDDRISLFKEQGVDEVLILNLGTDLLHLSAEEFIDKIIAKLSPRYIIIGDDFCFGHEARGNYITLQKSDHEAQETIVIKPLLNGAHKISTSLIKEKLLEGDLSLAHQMLGYNFKRTGLVTKGYGLGNKIGYPTANISLDPSYFLPRLGVYFVRVHFEGETYFGMASLGYHPTVNEVRFPLLEVNLFDFSGDLYHKVLTVEFLTYLRPELKLDSIAELILKIDEDRQVCYKLIEKGDF